MATVTGFTAERMLEIENNSVVSGIVVGDDLVLTRQGGGQINAGDVRGPQGVQGPVGEVSDADLAAALLTEHVDTAQLLDGSVTTTKLGPDAVTSAKLADLAVGGEHVQLNSINNGHLAGNSVDSGQYVDGSIDSVHLANNAVTAGKIANDVINSQHYAAGSIDLEHLANDSVNSSKISASAVGTSELATDAVTGAKIADNAVNSQHYVDRSIDSIHIAVNAVTVTELATTAWTNGTYLNGFTTYLSRQQLQYRKLYNDVVWIRGDVKPWSNPWDPIGAGERYLMQLPVGFRPPKDIECVVSGSLMFVDAGAIPAAVVYGTPRAFIKTDGYVELYGMDNAWWSGVPIVFGINIQFSIT